MDASFVQTNFLGGALSPPAQTRTDLPTYKTALKSCTNAWPRINGAWTRRPGFQFMAHTRQGKAGRLIGLEYSYQKPFQLELTNGTMRAYLGQNLILTGDNDVTVKSISTANPAVVTVAGNLPSTWANGDTIVFNFAQHMSVPVLSGRQFTIASIATSTFALTDALTGANVDGSALVYAGPLFGIDRIFKIQEWTLPYINGEWADVRLVKNGTLALLLHANHQPQSVTFGSSGLSVAAQTFTDGPYLNINTTTTTLTPSAASGSVTLTASSGTGINNGYGFLPTDIGRLVRFQSAPAAWAAGTTYAKNATVLGSDNNIYQSVAGSNIGHDPTTDNATNWVLTGQTVTWTWLTITAVTSPTVVTATVNGSALPSLAASTSWQLGLWSDTTGWPTSGTWHEGRFWLGNKTIPNRIDASVANTDFNFAPSASDGTVGDGNAIAAPFNATDSSQLYWMLPSSEGVILGTDSGEWLVRASSFNDPITPTSIQIHRVSTYGCANVEPVLAQLTTVFVQREKRKVLDFDHYPYGETAGWFAKDLTLIADDKTASGIAEIRYQQEPNKLLWARRNDGVLVGSTFEHAPYGLESYNGWHDHALGGNRTVASISTGPSADGLSTTLYAVLNNATTGYYEAVALTQPFEDTTPSWAATFTDGTASPSAAFIMQTVNGDSFNGLRIYGLTDIAGQTVTPQIGGYDVGDFTVNSGGYVDVPFTSTFTKAAVDGLNNGTDYGLLSLPMTEAIAQAYTGSAIGAYNGETAVLAEQGVNRAFLDLKRQLLVVGEQTGLRIFDSITMAQLRDKFFGNPYFFGANIATYHPGTHSYYAHIGNSNFTPVVRIDVTDLSLVQAYGTTANFGPTGPGVIESAFQMIALSSGSTHFIAQGIHANGGPGGSVVLLGADPIDFFGQHTFSDTHTFLTPGADGSGVFYVLGYPAYEIGSSATPVSIYRVNVSTPVSAFSQATPMAVTTIGTLSPAQIDATWTKISKFVGFGYDPTDGHLLAMTANNFDTVTNPYYWLKINSATGAIVWKTAVTVAQIDGQLGTTIAWDQVRPATGKFCYFSAGNPGNWNSLDTATGILTSTAFGGNLSLTTSDSQFYWPEQRAIIVGTTANSLGTLIPLGAYAAANPTWSNLWSYLTLGPGPTSKTFSIPATIGMTYTSSGQLLKPDFGAESGARNGPGFGKIRRHHWYGATIVRGQTFQIGTNPSGTLYNVPMLNYVTNQTSAPAPVFYSGTVSNPIEDTYSFDNSIYWQVSRPVPLTISAIGGYLATQDK